jgi:hypothetical protein
MLTWKNPLAWLQTAFSALTTAGMARFKAMKLYDSDLSGYSKQQGTRPATLGYALADSPAGLLAWIAEKIVDWSDEYPWTDDESMYPICYLDCFP